MTGVGLVRAKADSYTPIRMILMPVFEASLSCFFNRVSVEVLVTHTTTAELGRRSYRMGGWLFSIDHSVHGTSLGIGKSESYNPNRKFCSRFLNTA